MRHVEHALILVEKNPETSLYGVQVLVSRRWLSDWSSLAEARAEAKKLKNPHIEVVPAQKWHNGES